MLAVVGFGTPGFKKNVIWSLGVRKVASALAGTNGRRASRPCFLHKGELEWKDFTVKCQFPTASLKMCLQLLPHSPKHFRDVEHLMEKNSTGFCSSQVKQSGGFFISRPHIIGEENRNLCCVFFPKSAKSPPNLSTPLVLDTHSYLTILVT